MNNWLFRASDVLSSPLGFYVVLAAMAICTALVPLGGRISLRTALSVTAITGLVLIQCYRDTAALIAVSPSKLLDHRKYPVRPRHLPGRALSE